MKKKIALVTGASGGIGSACARLLAQRGYTVLAHANGNLLAAQALCDELRAQSLDAHAICCDLSDSSAVSQMCREILHVYHHVDALVLCAGVSHTGLLTDMTDEQWHRVMDVNVSGSFYLIRALVPDMVSRRSGAIVTISSMWGRSGASCEAAYSASKAAIIGLTQALAEGNYNYIDRNGAPTKEEKRKREIEAYGCDYYIASSNAITEMFDVSSEL